MKLPLIPGDLRGRRAVVVGLGHSGRAAALLLARLGAEVIATDRSDFAGGTDVLGPLREAGVQMRLGSDGSSLPDGDLIVVSPGVPPRPEWEVAQARGISVISETELASRCLVAPICAIGGTNGKSTVTTLVGAILEAAARRAFVGGNLGRPACEAPMDDWDVVVFEVSSFQMERLETFRPRVSVLLGVSEDHLDRYDSFEHYVAAKGNAFACQTAEDVAVIPFGDEICRTQAERGQGRIITFGGEGDYRLTSRGVLEVASGELFDLGSSDLHGRHNWLNAAAAIAATRALGVASGEIAKGLLSFAPLPHRMALAGRVGEVAFYDDSKATNVGAAVTALLGLTESFGVMILGGRDKLGSYEPLVKALSERGRAAIVLGEAKQRIAAALRGVVPVESASTMSEAVRLAFDRAQPGDAVLLSPACSSLDMYKNYADRGKQFIEAVLDLKKSQKEVPP